MNDSTIRVLHCIYSLAWGGAEKQLYLLTNASERVGMKPAIFCIDRAEMSDAEMKCPIYQYLRQHKVDPGIFREVKHAIRNFGPDIVHVWLPAVVTIPGMLAAALNGIPCVFSYRNAMRFWAFPQVPEFLVMLGLANKIVTNNPIENSGALFRWAYRAKSGEEIENAVDSSEIASEPRVLVEKASRVILFVGRIEAQKNWPCLLHAFALLRETSDHELLICGEGVEQPDMLSMIDRLQLSTSVKLLGRRKDIGALMRAADVVVLPSLFEGVPNVALEACAAGVPLVLSDIAGHRLFKNVGAAQMFDPRSPESLAGTLGGLFRNPSAVSSAQRNGLNLALQRSSEVMASRYREAYLDSIKRCHRSRLFI